MKFLLSAVAEACGGRLLPDPTTPAAPASAAAGSTEIDGVSIDSRSIGRGQLFVPIVAERDGHEFIAAAIAAGATAYLTARPDSAPPGAVAVQVADTAVALAALGRAARSRIAGPVVGVTGSVGKTSVKDLTAAALSSRFVTTSSLRSFNNELGVPLTLANGAPGTEAAVIEMGARGEGHIGALCDIARPTIGIVTRVAPAHLELFGTVEAVARAKGELVEALPAGPAGVAVLNADDPLVLAMASRTRADVLTYGQGGDLRAEHVVLDQSARARFRVVTPWGHGELQLPVPGAHMVGNALAAIGAAVVAGAELDGVVAAMAGAQLSPWRMEVSTNPEGVTVLNDAYNASPVAMRAAFDALLALGERGRGRRVAVLGAMAELGDGGAALHRALGDEAVERGIEVYAVGTDLYGVDADRRWDDIAAAVVGLRSLGLGSGDVVLLKASRVVGLERLAAGFGAVTTT